MTKTLENLLQAIDEFSFAQQNPDITGHISVAKRNALESALRELIADAEKWKALYRRAINEANGLTNYVEDRPELYSAEKRIRAIQVEAGQRRP